MRSWGIWPSLAPAKKSRDEVKSWPLTAPENLGQIKQTQRQTQNLANFVIFSVAFRWQFCFVKITKSWTGHKYWNDPCHRSIHPEWRGWRFCCCWYTSWWLLMWTSWISIIFYGGQYYLMRYLLWINHWFAIPWVAQYDITNHICFINVDKVGLLLPLKFIAMFLKVISTCLQR